MENNPDIKSLTLSSGKSYSVRSHRDRFFFPKEWKKYFDCLKQSQKKTNDCLISTGARINEIRNVEVGDIDLGNKRIILRITKVKSKKGEKNPRPRTIPISSQFARRLKSYVKDKDNNEKIGLLSTPASNIAMKKSLQKAGIKDWQMFSIHNIRKTIENWLLALGVDGVTISRHFGHDIHTALQHYASPDIFSWKEKTEMREIIGDLYLK
ncbi:MAG: tyrosine-type recombinase/integrase [Arcobacteraceae bacterium]|nr:tyrosine-type recombinase/integrase [Arcobacteraceae bacterium]